MPPMKQLRVWHAMIAILATAAYLSEDVEPWHQLLGYGVVAMLAIRLLMALFGAGSLGLQRFYPKFHDLKLRTAATNPAISRLLLLGIALSLLGVTVTGVLMDQGKTLKLLSGQSLSRAANGTSYDAAIYETATSSDSDSHGPRSPRAGDHADDEDEDEEGPLGEVHELFANLLIGLVALHVSYLVLFKWPLARFMLFIRQPGKSS